MKKHQINYSRLINTEFYQFLNLIVTAASNADPVIHKFESEYLVVEGILKRLLVVLNREKASKWTKEIKKLDNRRDFAFTGFRLWLLGLTKYPKLPQKEAAKTILSYLNLHGKRIAQQNFQVESALLTKIVDDFKKESKLVTALSILNANDWTDEIEQANMAFILTYNSRSLEIGENKSIESFVKVRKEAILAYEKLVDMIESRYKIAIADNTDAAPLQKCLNEIDATIIQYRQLIKATKANKKNNN